MDHRIVTNLRGRRLKDGGLELEFHGRPLMSTDSLCLYTMPNGTVQCASCDHPPANSNWKSAAPPGLPEGNYAADDPRLNETQGDVLPQGEGEV